MSSAPISSTPLLSANPGSAGEYTQSSSISVPSARIPVILGLDAQTPGIGVGVAALSDGAILFGDWVAVDRRQGTYERESLAALRSLPFADLGWDVVALAIERVGGGRGVQAMLTVANCAGIVAAHAAALWPEANLYRPTPGEWKKASGISGNANKDMVRERARELAPDALCAQWEEIDVRQDAYDAVLIAYGEWRNFDAATRGQIAS